MPIQFSVYPFGRLVVYTVETVPTPAEAGEFLDAVLAHRKFRREFAFLGETTAGNVPHAAFTTALAQEVLARRNRFAPCKWAVLVLSEVGLDLVQKRAESLLDSDIEVAAFLTMDDAMNWLGTVTVRPGDSPAEPDAPERPSDSPETP
jgi:hypothetical protein